MSATRITMILCCFFAKLSFGQQDAQFTQYMFNPSVINPAYAGSKGYLTIGAIHRSQWVGLEGAPRTQTLAAHSPVNNNMGIGLSVVRDEIGPANEIYVSADLAYTIALGKETLLAFGIKAGIHNLDVDFEKLTIFDPTDQSFIDNVDNRMAPVVGTGAFLYARNWYLGFSSPNLLTTKHFGDSRFSQVAETLHFYTIAGYVLDLNDHLKFKPATLVKFTKGAPLALDVSVNFLFYETFSLGASHRLDAGVSVLAGFHVTPQLMLGYAYDYDTTALGNYNSGSHEIFIRFHLLRSILGKTSPRFF